MSDQTICNVQMLISVPVLREQRDLCLTLFSGLGQRETLLLDGLVGLLDSILDCCEEESRDV